MTRMNDRIIDADLFKRRVATPDTVRKLADWDLWVCEDDAFDHDYDRTVSFYVQQGAATLTFASGEVMDIQSGDFVTIQTGASAHWDIKSPIHNRYQYHDSFLSASHRQDQVYWSGKPIANDG